MRCTLVADLPRRFAEALTDEYTSLLKVRAAEGAQPSSPRDVEEEMPGSNTGRASRDCDSGPRRPVVRPVVTRHDIPDLLRAVGIEVAADSLHMRDLLDVIDADGNNDIDLSELLL